MIAFSNIMMLFYGCSDGGIKHNRYEILESPHLKIPWWICQYTTCGVEISGAVGKKNGEENVGKIIREAECKPVKA